MLVPDATILTDLPMATFSIVPSYSTFVSFLISVATHYDKKNLREKCLFYFIVQGILCLRGEVVAEGA